jgi:hypothetical protein
VDRDDDRDHGLEPSRGPREEVAVARVVEAAERAAEAVAPVGAAAVPVGAVERWAAEVVAAVEEEVEVAVAGVEVEVAAVAGVEVEVSLRSLSAAGSARGPASSRARRRWR